MKEDVTTEVIDEAMPTGSFEDFMEMAEEPIDMPMDEMPLGGEAEEELIHEINQPKDPMGITAEPEDDNLQAKDLLDDTEYNEVDAYGNALYPMNELRTKEDFMFDGVCRHIFDPQWTMRVLHNYKCGIIIFDDCRAYFPARTEQVIHELMIRRRQREVDMIAVGHGFTEVPPKFFTFATDYVLFRTEDSIDTRKPYIRSFEKVKRMQASVNRKAKHNPHYHQRMKQ